MIAGAGHTLHIRRQACGSSTVVRNRQAVRQPELPLSSDFKNGPEASIPKSRSGAQVLQPDPDVAG